MPIYEYQCKKCGEKFEVLQKFSEAPLKRCECGQKGAVKKLVSAAAFHLKGDGWYVTDFRDKGKKKPGANGEGDSKSDGAEKAAEKADGKTDAKSDSKPGADSKPESGKPDSGKSESTGKKGKGAGTAATAGD